MCKFKKWLIEKLGGTVEKSFVEPKITHNEYNYLPLEASVMVPNLADADAQSNRENYIKEELIEAIFDAIKEMNIIEFQKKKDECSTTVYTAKILLLENKRY